MNGTLFSTEPGAFHFRSYFALGAQIASLFVTGWLVWTVVLSLEPLPNTIGWVLGLSLLAWCWCAGMMAGLHLLFAEPILVQNGRALLRTSTAAVWFVPTAILLAEYSPAAIVAGLILVVNTTRVLYSELRLAHQGPEQTLSAPCPDHLFEEYANRAPALLRRLAPKWTLAFFAQAGVVAMMMRNPLLAAGCFAMSAALLTAVGMAAGIFPQSRPWGLPASAMASLLTLLLAVSLTVVSLTREPARRTHQLQDLSFQPGRGLVSNDDRHPRTPPKGTEHRLAEAAVPRYDPAGDTGKVGDNEFPGVILWPEVKPVTTLVAFIPSGFSLSSRATRPLGIPFSGEYWMFRAPSTRPPYGSFFERGNPASLSFSTTDHAPLEMEAHDRLEQSIDLHCCRTIQVAIWNGDHYPGTVALELILIDRGQQGRPSLSLGTNPVRSSPGSEPVRETLDFSVPTAPKFRRFDEIEIVFHRDRNRIDKSARIEIERFVLVPVNSL